MRWFSSETQWRGLKHGLFEIITVRKTRRGEAKQMGKTPASLSRKIIIYSRVYHRIAHRKRYRSLISPCTQQSGEFKK